MEIDGKTRVYLTSGENAWEIYPVQTRHEDQLVGVAAQAVFSHVDFRGVYHLVTSRATLQKTTAIREGFGIEDINTHERFDISTLGLPLLDGDIKVANELEKRTGKKGLTIVLS